MRLTPPTLEAAIRRPLDRLDAVVTRLFGEARNPLYQSGTIAVLMLVVLLVTGLWLLLFYRIGAPWASVARLQADPWLGRWVRALHRYAADGALLAIGAHMLRMYAQGRTWGPRALAWLTGLVLLGLTLICGWTGYVMVWDGFGRDLAQEGARLVDALPILSERLGRTFTGDRPPPAFFFLNLFLHVALPLGLAAVLWLHVSRIARPVLLPPRGLRWPLVWLLLALSILWPAPLDPEADAFLLPGGTAVDLWYAFWLPVSSRLPAAVVWSAGLAATVALAMVPRWSRRLVEERPASTVDERLCTGCEQCSLDCPYGAITMQVRNDGRATLVAAVDPSLCVSCGICAGSCAPMGVGPAGRTGRDQLGRIQAFMTDRPEAAGNVVVLGCSHSAGQYAHQLEQQGAVVLGIDCAGSLHSSVVEYALRGGASGVLILACPPRDCRNREGPRWLDARLFHEREAELQERVDRRRVRVAYLGGAERGEALETLASFVASLAALERPATEEEITVERPCSTETAGEESVR